MTTAPLIEPPKETQMSNDERKRLIEESATQFARLFLEQVLENRRAKKQAVSANNQENTSIA
jgi:lauroyl/myristoyl acyltransferase